MVLSQISLHLWNETKISQKMIILKEIIIDRKSKYTAVWWYVESYEEVWKFIKSLHTESYFKNATHNSYAYRIQQSNGSILEWKNDDGEIWAWMCILREIQRENGINMILVITRYFWWIKLESDRFKNVIQASKIFFQQNK
jgi:putative IMPACT (imprinted ancient) family translation regulator